jgi:hypothetical protein
MAYTDEAKFNTDYEAAQKKAMSMGLSESVVVSADVAFNFYMETFAPVAKEGRLPFQIFGRLLLDDHDRFIDLRARYQAPPEDVGIDIIVWQNLPMLKLDQWNMAVNDIWVLAAVNSLQEFYPASLVTEANILHDKHTLTIMGRELVGLALAGYSEQSGHKALGKIYVHGDKEKAAFLSLPDYQAGLSKLTSVPNAKAFFEKARFVIE